MGGQSGATKLAGLAQEPWGPHWPQSFLRKMSAARWDKDVPGSTLDCPAHPYLFRVSQLFTTVRKHWRPLSHFSTCTSVLGPLRCLGGDSDTNRFITGNCPKFHKGEVLGAPRLPLLLRPPTLTPNTFGESPSAYSLCGPWELSLI